MTVVYRIQRKDDGRGPFRPGFSFSWSDDEGHALRATRPPWFEEFGEGALADALPGEHFGSAVRIIDELANWFSAGERRRLAGVGYVCVRVPDARILRESGNQVLFARAKPLNVGINVVRWP